jgi:hypothetical protein
MLIYLLEFFREFGEVLIDVVDFSWTRCASNVCIRAALALQPNISIPVFKEVLQISKRIIG